MWVDTAVWGVCVCVCMGIPGLGLSVWVDPLIFFFFFFPSSQSEPIVCLNGLTIASITPESLHPRLWECKNQFCPLYSSYNKAILCNLCTFMYSYAALHHKNQRLVIWFTWSSWSPLPFFSFLSLEGTMVVGKKGTTVEKQQANKAKVVFRRWNSTPHIS